MSKVQKGSSNKQEEKEPTVEEERALLFAEMVAARDIAREMFGDGVSAETVFGVYDRLGEYDDPADKDVAIAELKKAAADATTLGFTSAEAVFGVYDRLYGVFDEDSDD